MVKINQDALVKSIPEILKKSGADVPVWMNRINDIVTGVNKMLDAYKEIAGQNKPVITSHQVTDATPAVQMGFEEARRVKKAEMATRSSAEIPPQITPKSEVANMNEIKGILEGLIKSTDTLQKMGFGDKRIGEVILEMPFSVDQVKTFLEKLHASRYSD